MWPRRVRAPNHSARTAGVDGRRPREARRLSPQDLAHEQIAQVFAAVHVACEQQDASGRSQHEGDADHRLLHLGPDALGPGQQQRPGERCRERRDLDRDALRLEPELVGEQHATAGDLRNGEIDEDDATRQHLRSERHMRRGHENAGDKRRQQYRKLGCREIHCAPLSRRAIVSSNRP